MPSEPSSPRKSDHRPDTRPGERLQDKRNLFERVVEFLSPGPDSKDELIETLADAEDRELIDPDSRAMLEGVLRMADLSAGDVMVAAPRMRMLDLAGSTEDWLDTVIDTGHSRFPVFDQERDNIVGIFLAKDLLKLQRSPDLSLRTLLRPTVFVPETKRVPELLQELQTGSQMAIVVDEYGMTAGLVTVEDMIEEIVGEIYDPSRSAWQPWYYAGNRVKLAQNQEQFFFDGASGLVRFVKPATTTNVGLTIFYA